MSLLPKFTGRNVALGLQHTLAMFGSTVLVPLITGMSPCLALICAGLGTLAFHLCTKGMVPAFMGSSFAYIPALCAVIAGNVNNIPKAQAGVVAAGLVYFVFALLVKIIGSERIRKVFPPVVTGPVIIIIGLALTGVGIKDAFGFWGEVKVTTDTIVNASIALVTFVTMVLCMNLKKGIFQALPILCGIAVGYGYCLMLRAFGLFSMDFYDTIAKASWLYQPIGDKWMTLPQFDWATVTLFAPIALVTFMEHLGDVQTNGAVVGKDFFKDPGLHRTLLGDGLATVLAGILGGPANTTYSENTGVLATTKNYNPEVLRLAAVFAFFIGLFGKFGAFLLTIPGPVKGGIEIMLFGMIAAIGIRIIVEARLDMTSNRSLCIMAGTLCTGIGIGAVGGYIPVPIGSVTFNFSGLFVATLVGIIMNFIIPNSNKEDNDNGK